MIIYKTAEEVEKLRAAAQVVSRTLGKVAELVEPGVTPLELDAKAEEYIRSQNAVPGFLGLYDFPNSLCISINEQVVHGIPNEEPLEEGDIISVDCGAVLDGYYGDHAFTFPVGEINDECRKLLDVTRQSLFEGINKAEAGLRLGDIGFAIQNYAESFGYGIVRELVGHGIGQTMHEDPQIANYGKQGRGKKIKNGLTIAIEPMVNMGTHKIKQLEDNWTIVTADGKPSAHFEHDVAVVEGKPEILSTFEYIYEVWGDDAI